MALIGQSISCFYILYKPPTYTTLLTSALMM
jgi:hypothetical protein